MSSESTIIDVIIPAHNEAESIDKVIADIPPQVRHIVVVDNASTDNTAEVAEKAGAICLHEIQKGYGFACLKGIAYLNSLDKKTYILVFLDGDYSDYPEELSRIVAPILEQDYDLVIGTRKAKLRAKGSMTFPQRFGNWLATKLMRLFYGAKFTDLGPFRAIKFQKLLSLNMQDKTYGWTVEMQLKALKHQFKYTEIPVKYRNRIGKSKVSGTLKGAIFAGVKILWWIFKYGLKK
ncbi:MAG: glycosyltransferase family 2 protein [Flavobacteriaceae bacterium]|nr:glycosyltransferase family 2 protein [Flavobacteriaceae bacterium]